MEGFQMLMTAAASGLIMPVVQWVKKYTQDIPAIPFILTYGLSIGVGFASRWLFQLEWDTQTTITNSLAYIGTIAQMVHVTAKTKKKMNGG